MNKSFLSLSIVIFGICVLVGSWLVSNALQDIAKQTPDTVTVTQPEQIDWELIVVNEKNIVLFNNKSGEYWSKTIESGEEPTDWEKSPLPWKPWE
ncbi:hypothetical protein FQ087_12535 [Sporosarcina sp. ANT_H38]|uniref:hypothetical protein n=1 Tax=Sporosarcina sp. ANT_H38 TaxID=2597358 RepID=UPI0011F3C141|nr:hypothetical protein [Sporosarcina sp. ANT_H38]KAA0955438.1 hypothetical protein FQ087_12535 [Sporosarcina sp. ANT_H38]